MTVDIETSSAALKGSATQSGSYAWWRGAAESLLKPLTALMLPGKADLPLQGQASNHGPAADRLESFARPCLLAAHWLASEPARAESLSRDEIAAWFRHGLLLGTDPKSAEYWGPTANHHQHTVEMCALTLALQIARKSLWDALTAQEREQVANWFASIRGAGLHRNNHMMFNVMTLAFLDQVGFGRRTDALTSRFLMDAIEGMALGEGWFIDGMNETVDYYNAYAFHYYGLWWAKLYGQTDPARAKRWRQWAGSFLKDYVHFFAATGENPPFGRSICYRFAASAPFALAEFASAPGIPPGQARRVCTRNLEFFLRHPIQQAQHALSIGWTDEFPELSEAYTCAGSTYWAAKAFAPLLLPSNHRFWQMPEKPLPSEGGPCELAIPQAGLVVRSHEGEVELLNNANGICVGNIKFGTYKWGKLGYRSGYGFEISREENRYPLDAALTAEFADGSIHGRHQCQPIAVARDHCGSVYGLGDRFSQNHVSVETRIWWKGGWQLQWHRLVAYARARFRLGTYSLPLPESDKGESSIAAGFAFVRGRERGIAIQPLTGFAQVLSHSSSPAKRTHLLAPNSTLLAAETDWLTGEHQLVALVWAGISTKECTAWTVKATRRGELLLQHPVLGSWRIEEPELPVIPAAA